MASYARSYECTCGSSHRPERYAATAAPARTSAGRRTNETDEQFVIRMVRELEENVRTDRMRDLLVRADIVGLAQKIEICNDRLKRQASDAEAAREAEETEVAHTGLTVEESEANAVARYARKHGLEIQTPRDGTVAVERYLASPDHLDFVRRRRSRTASAR